MVKNIAQTFSPRTHNKGLYSKILPIINLKLKTPDYFKRDCNDFDEI